jgi:hypothetical protein
VQCAQPGHHYLRHNQIAFLPCLLVSGTSKPMGTFCSLQIMGSLATIALLRLRFGLPKVTCF